MIYGRHAQGSPVVCEREREGRRTEGEKAREHMRKTENELNIKTKITENTVMRVESWLGARSPGFQFLF